MHAATAIKNTLRAQLRTRLQPRRCEVLQYRDSGGRWITIGGSPGENGQHEGGTPVQVDESGNILKGPQGLADKGIDSLNDFELQRPKNKPRDPKQTPQDLFDKRAEPARGFGPGVQELPDGRAVGAGTATVDQLSMDAPRFQYKVEGVGAEGVTENLKDVRRFRPEFAGQLAVWRDPADGKTYVVNGHHRFELAKRTGYQGSLNVFFLDAANWQEARAQGALANMASGHGTALDAAKFLRDTKTTVEDLRSEGVSIKGKVASDAAILSDLSEHIFRRIAGGMESTNRGLAIAKHVQDHDLQNDLYKDIQAAEAKGRQVTDSQVEEMAREVATAPTTKQQQGDLFGGWEEVKSLRLERAQAKAHLRKALASKMRTFAEVSKRGRAGALAAAGNVIDEDANKAIAQESAEALYAFDKLVNSKGELSDAINTAARELSERPRESKRILGELERIAQRALASAYSGSAEASSGGREAFSRPRGREWVERNRRPVPIGPAVRIALDLALRLRYRKGSTTDGKWVTIGGSPGEKGEHEGGTPVKIDGTGNILAGPKALADKGIKSLDDFGGKGQGGQPKPQSYDEINARIDELVNLGQQRRDAMDRNTYNFTQTPDRWLESHELAELHDLQQRIKQTPEYQDKFGQEAAQRRVAEKRAARREAAQQQGQAEAPAPAANPAKQQQAKGWSTAQTAMLDASILKQQQLALRSGLQWMRRNGISQKEVNAIRSYDQAEQFVADRPQLPPSDVGILWSYAKARRALADHEKAETRQKQIEIKQRRAGWIQHLLSTQFRWTPEQIANVKQSGGGSDQAGQYAQELQSLLWELDQAKQQQNYAAGQWSEQKHPRSLGGQFAAEVGDDLAKRAPKPVTAPKPLAGQRGLFEGMDAPGARPANVQRQLFSAIMERLRYRKGSTTDERWITIGGDEGEKGKHEGGTPVKIDGTGNILAGPKALADKGIKSLDDFGGKGEPDTSSSSPPAEPADDVKPVEEAPAAKSSPVTFTLRGHGKWKFSGDDSEKTQRAFGSWSYKIESVDQPGRTAELVDFGQGQWEAREGKWPMVRRLAGGNGKNPIEAAKMSRDMKETTADSPPVDPAVVKRSLQAKLAAAVEAAPAESKETVESHVQVLQAVMDSLLTPKSLEAVDRNLTGGVGRTKPINVYPDLKSMQVKLEEISGQDNTDVYGAFVHSSGIRGPIAGLHVDGDAGESQGDEDVDRTREGIYSHELAHAIDGPEYTYSSTKEWKAAFKAEIDYVGHDVSQVEGERYEGTRLTKAKKGLKIAKWSAEKGAWEERTVTSVRKSRKRGYKEIHTAEGWIYTAHESAVLAHWPLKTTEQRARLSRYATTQPREGWAELFRLYHRDRPKAEASFPKCVALLKKWNLV